jgi:putative DNA primase/helicase
VSLAELVVLPPHEPDTPALRELIAIDRWVCWRHETVNGRPTKVPYQPNGWKAATDDPATWTTYERARTAVLSGGREFAGVGFVLEDDDDLTGWDLDKCRDPVTGAIDPEAAAVVDELGSYAEATPSDTGIRVLVRGKLPPSGRNNRDRKIECYEDGRFLTITGRHLAGTTTTIERRQDAIDAVHAAIFGAAASRPAPIERTPQPVDMDDNELLRKAFAAKNGADVERLWRGQWSPGYGSQSEADLALCNHLAFYTGREAGRINRLFRASGLYREKWDEKHFSSGATYGQETIQKAINATVEVYEPPTILSVVKANVRPPPPPPSDAAHDDTPTDRLPPVENLTDLGNARRLVRRHGASFRYIKAWREFAIWTGKRWQVDDTLQMPRWAKETTASIYAEAAEAPSDNRRVEIGKWAQKSESQDRINAMMASAQSEPSIPVKAEVFDRDPYLLNLLNGTLELRTGDLRPHRREDYLTKIIALSYDPEATCPRWIQFLEEVFAGDQDLIGFVQRFLGSCLTGDVSDHALALFFGGGRNGKSTLIGVVQEILGDYAMTAKPDLLMSKRGDGDHPTELADLFGKRLVSTIEVEDGRRLAEALVKSLTGGDRIRARRMRENFWEFDPTHKVVVVANHKPTIRGTDVGIWSRIKIVPFTVSFKGREDRTLRVRLRAEAAGILNWLLAGCRAWQEHGLGEPKAVTDATEQYRDEQDVLKGFLDEYVVADEHAKTPIKKMYATYREWCEQAGERPEPQRAFDARMTERGFTTKRNAPNGANAWQGLGFRSTEALKGAEADSASSLHEDEVGCLTPEKLQSPSVLQFRVQNDDFAGEIASAGTEATEDAAGVLGSAGVFSAVAVGDRAWRLRAGERLDPPLEVTGFETNVVGETFATLEDGTSWPAEALELVFEDGREVGDL